MAFNAYFAAPTVHVYGLNFQTHIVVNTLHGFCHSNHVPYNAANFMARLFYRGVNLLAPGSIDITGFVGVDLMPNCAIADALCFSDADNHSVAFNVVPLPGLNYRGMTRAILLILQHLNADAALQRFAADLLVAAAHRDLTARNVRSYFLQFQIDLPESDFFAAAINNTAARNRADLLVANGRNLINNTQWGGYRLRVSAVGTAYENFRTIYGDVVINRILNAHQRAGLELTRDEPWNRVAVANVDRNALGIVACGLRTARCLPDTWVSGTNAFEAMGGGLKSRYMELFEIILEFLSNRRDLLLAPNIGDLLTRAGF